jgi:hypothetical protein
MSIEARMLTNNNAELIAEWCGGRVAVQRDALDDSLPAIHGVNVPIKDGVGRAQVGDTIICEGPGLYRIEKRQESGR